MLGLGTDCSETPPPPSGDELVKRPIPSTYQGSDPYAARSAIRSVMTLGDDELAVTCGSQRHRVRYSCVLYWTLNMDVDMVDGQVKSGAHS